MQTVSTTDKEKFEMYNTYDKDVIIRMLIECNKHLWSVKPTVIEKCFYMAGMDTSGRCIHCGKQRYEH